MQLNFMQWHLVHQYELLTLWRLTSYTPVTQYPAQSAKHEAKLTAFNYSARVLNGFINNGYRD